MMKKYLLLFGIALSILSCSLSKANKTSRKTINGTWTLNDVSYENAGHYKSTLFNDAQGICFEGSEWFFRENNSTGHYSLLNASQCDSNFRYIRWSVVEGTPNQLQFKFTDEKKKDLTGSGYRLIISSLSDQEMTLKNNVISEEGNQVTLVYKFTKKSI